MENEVDYDDDKFNFEYEDQGEDSNLYRKDYEGTLSNNLDKKIGTAEKIIVHEYAMLHRAFSILIFRKRNKKIETLLMLKYCLN